MGKKVKKDILYETDNQGKHQVVKQSNGIVIKILEEPSEEYMEKIKKKREISKEKNLIATKKRKKEQLIKDKIRELAIRELEKEGLI